MKVKEIYEKIKEEYGKDNNRKLAHVFMMPSSNFDIKKDKLEEKDTEVHLGFLCEENNKIFTIRKAGSVLEEIPGDNIFQKEENEVHHIELEKVTIDIDEAIEKARTIVIEEFPETVSMKLLLVLQNIISYGFIWNITILRRDFQTVNIKIDAATGKVKHKSCKKLFDIQK